MLYKFRWRRRLFWKSFQVSGHRWEKEQDKMVLYFADGSIYEIPEWVKCQARLGADWVLAAKKDLESKAGTAIPLNV